MVEKSIIYETIQGECKGMAIDINNFLAETFLELLVGYYQRG